MPKPKPAAVRAEVIVNYCGVYNLKTGTMISREGWRISVIYDDKYMTVNPNRSMQPFASKRDAEIALAALEAAGIVTAQKILQAGAARVAELMFSDLAW